MENDEDLVQLDDVDDVDDDACPATQPVNIEIINQNYVELC